MFADAETQDSFVPSNLWESVNTPTLLVAIALIAGGLYFYLKDVRNPQRAASNSVLAGATEAAGSLIQIAQESLEKSTAAHRSALEAVQANVRCEQKVMALIAHNRQLSEQLVGAGITPAPMPEELME